jgi:hypothetical protein
MGWGVVGWLMRVAYYFYIIAISGIMQGFVGVLF